jgi:hypothetical protein
MSGSREIPYAEFSAMEARSELSRGPMGDGRDGQGRNFAIYRYTSKTTGRRYDVVRTAGDPEPRCIEYPPYDPSA